MLPWSEVAKIVAKNSNRILNIEPHDDVGYCPETRSPTQHNKLSILDGVAAYRVAVEGLCIIRQPCKI